MWDKDNPGPKPIEAKFLVSGFRFLEVLPFSLPQESCAKQSEGMEEVWVKRQCIF